VFAVRRVTTNETLFSDPTKLLALHGSIRLRSTTAIILKRTLTLKR
jgi:hypothetical protein